jgi:DNA-binding MarR family transcriptional regulator
MTTSLESGNLALRLWFMIHRTHEMLKMCEDRVFREYKLTTEQYVVLLTINYLDGPVRPTDVARWLGRSPNSVSMIVDRMVKASLLRRVRDRKDRRVVWLTITSKGETALKPAIMAGFEFIQNILSRLSYDDRHTLMELLDKLQYAAADYLNPGADIEEIRRNEAKSHDNLMERLIQYCGPQLLETKR